MGEGLKRATLESVLTRGPWKVEGSTLTAAEVRAVYEAAPDVVKMVAALGVDSLSSRKADRALQVLRRAGLLRFADRKWVRA